MPKTTTVAVKCRECGAETAVCIVVQDGEKVAPVQPKVKKETGWFEAWWRLYPRKTAKRDAEKAWMTLAPSPEQAAMLMEAARRQLKWPIEPQYRPYPATWLRGERWLDEAPTGGSGLPYRRSTSAADSTTDAIVAAAQSVDARRSSKVMPAIEVRPTMKTTEPPKMVETEEGDHDDF